MANESYVWNWLRNHGLNPIATAGVMGNLEQESGISSTAVNKSSGAYGIAQWLGGRKAKLMNQKNYTSIDTQLNFLLSELKAGGNGSINTLNSKKTPQSAADYFETSFERAGSGANLKSREGYATNIYNQFSGEPLTQSNTSTLGGGLGALPGVIVIGIVAYLVLN